MPRIGTRKSCDQRTEHGASGARTNTARRHDGPLRGVALNDRVGKRKRRTHQHRRQERLDQHRPHVEPHLRPQPSDRRRDIDALTDRDRGIRQSACVRPGDPPQRRRHEQTLQRDEPFGRTVSPAMQPATDRSDGDAAKNDRQEHRIHGAQRTEQQREVAKPDDLHAHRRHAAERESDTPGRSTDERVVLTMVPLPAPEAAEARRRESACRVRAPSRRREVQERRHRLRDTETEDRHEREVGQQRTNRGAESCWRHRAAPGVLRRSPIALDDVAHEHCQRSAHRNGDRPMMSTQIAARSSHDDRDRTCQPAGSTAYDDNRRQADRCGRTSRIDRPSRPIVSSRTRSRRSASLALARRRSDAPPHSCAPSPSMKTAITSAAE